MASVYGLFLLWASAALIGGSLIPGRGLPSRREAAHGLLPSLLAGTATVVGLDQGRFRPEPWTFLGVGLWTLLFFSLYLTLWAVRRRAPAAAGLAAGLSFGFTYAAVFSIGPLTQGLAWLQLATAAALRWPGRAWLAVALWPAALFLAWSTWRLLW